MSKTDESEPLHVLDLFSGLGGWSRAFQDRGHQVDTLDYEEKFDPTFCMDVRDFHPEAGAYDLVLASPDCRRFSVAALARHWEQRGHVHYPKTGAAREAVEVVRAALRVIREAAPAWWILENPRGKLRSLPVLKGLPRRTVTYCQYGEIWQKPTDLWGSFPPTLKLQKPCSPGDGCHEAAPRGSKTGVQGVLDPAVRAVVPYKLSLAVCVAVEKAVALGATVGVGDEPALGPALPPVQATLGGVVASHSDFTEERSLAALVQGVDESASGVGVPVGVGAALGARHGFAGGHPGGDGGVGGVGRVAGVGGGVSCHSSGYTHPSICNVGYTRRFT